MSKTLWWGACALLLVGACGGGDGPGSVCVPGASAACSCAGGDTGSQICNGAGSGFGSCVCTGTDGGTGPSCGDGLCGAGESCSSCASDCGACPASCGDGTCGAGETCSSCASDCGECPPGGCSVRVSADGSSVSDSCSGSDICICDLDASCTSNCDLCLTPGSCEPAFPRRYALTPLVAYVPVTKPDGSGWDADGSGPDLYAQMSVDGSAPFRTATATDLVLDADGDFTAVYSGTVQEFNLVAGSAIQADVFDEDLTSDDGAFTCNWSASASDARLRILTCDGARGGFLATIVPR